MAVEFEPLDISDHLDSDEMIAGYLSAAAEDEDPNVLLRALLHAAKAHGMMVAGRRRGSIGRACTRRSSQARIRVSRCGGAARRLWRQRLGANAASPAGKRTPASGETAALGRIGARFIDGFRPPRSPPSPSRQGASRERVNAPARRADGRRTRRRAVEARRRRRKKARAKPPLIAARAARRRQRPRQARAAPPRCARTCAAATSIATAGSCNRRTRRSRSATARSPRRSASAKRPSGATLRQMRTRRENRQRKPRRQARDCAQMSHRRRTRPASAPGRSVVQSVTGGAERQEKVAADEAPRQP